MNVRIHFYSYFKDLSGCMETSQELADGSTVRELLERLADRFPKLRNAQASILVAVGVEYQGREHVLRQGDEVSLFPPVQGG